MSISVQKNPGPIGQYQLISPDATDWDIGFDILAEMSDVDSVVDAEALQRQTDVTNLQNNINIVHDDLQTNINNESSKRQAEDDALTLITDGLKIRIDNLVSGSPVDSSMDNGHRIYMVEFFEIFSSDQIDGLDQRLNLLNSKIGFKISGIDVLPGIGISIDNFTEPSYPRIITNNPIWNSIQNKPATIQNIDTVLLAKSDKLTTYTKTETNTVLAVKSDKVTTYTKSEVDALIQAQAGGVRPYSLIFTPEDITLSATDPYFDVSLPDQIITAVQFPDLAPKMRGKRARVNILGTKHNSFVVGAGYTANGASVTLQLANNAQNIVLLTAMAEAKAYFASGLKLGVINLPVIGNIPAGDNVITDVDTAGLTITFASTAAAGSTGGQSVIIYPHRIAVSATDAQHWMMSEIGFMLHGGAIVDGYPVRDQFQGHVIALTAAPDVPSGAYHVQLTNTLSSPTGTNSIGFISGDGINGPPRTGLKTRGPALGINVYYYCGLVAIA